MQRSKQQALMFLLGAVLVGGVMGYSADRVVEHFNQKTDQSRRIDRPSFFDDLGLTAEQRVKWNSIMDTTNCKILLLNAPLRLAMDSVREVSRTQWQALLTPEQRKRIEERARADSARRAAQMASRGRDGRAAGGGRDEGRDAPAYRPGNPRPGNRVSAEYCTNMFKERIKP